MQQIFWYDGEMCSTQLEQWRGVQHIISMVERCATHGWCGGKVCSTILAQWGGTVCSTHWNKTQDRRTHLIENSSAYTGRISMKISSFKSLCSNGSS
jgi:hypothetical protein